MTKEKLPQEIKETSVANTLESSIQLMKVTQGVLQRAKSRKELSVLEDKNNFTDHSNKKVDGASAVTIGKKSFTFNELIKSNEVRFTKKGVTFVGIDFGTSTTVVSIASADCGSEQIKIKPIELNQKLLSGAIQKSYKIPTMVGWYQNTVLVGEGANEQRMNLKLGINLWHSFKMQLGKDVGVMYPNSELNNDRMRILNPKDVSTLFFKYLKVQIEKYVHENELPKTIEYAITIPASFEANQRKDLLESLHANNLMLNKQALIDEPNAAFLSYVLDPDTKHDLYISEEEPTNILVFDFGAGTCDISILEIAKGVKGYYSKNKAISRFEELGGNDIDREIAEQIMYPQFLSQNNVIDSQFNRKQKKIILDKFEKTAEILKIKICESLSYYKDKPAFLSQARSDDAVVNHQTIDIRSREGNFSLNNPTMTYSEFNKIIDSFLQPKSEKSIVLLIEQVLKKGNLKRDEIDEVLFIGGSSKNPLIQEFLKRYFSTSHCLIPRDLQAHVSQGAAIHSLIFNGHGINLIDPITSEPILARVATDDDSTLVPLLKAGTKIPCSDITIDHLKIQREGQEIIEIPLYSGNENKILHNIRIESPDSGGFGLDTNIRLTLSINTDKVLKVIAQIDDLEELEVEPLNPFANKSLTLKQRKKFEVEKAYNKDIARNEGIETLSSLKRLVSGYEELGLYLDQAETLEKLYKNYQYGYLNNIGVAYSKSGDPQRALEYYKKDFEETNSAISALNIAMKYQFSNPSEHKSWLEKSLQIDPNYEPVMYLYGVVLERSGDKQKGLELINKAFRSWENQYERYQKVDNIHNFIACAKYLEKFDWVEKLEKQYRNKNALLEESEFEAKNLTKV